MHAHETQLRQVLVTGAGLILGYGLIAAGVLTETGGAAPFYLFGMGLLVVVAIFAFRWLAYGFLDPFGWIESIDSLFLLALFWVLGLVLLFLLLPFAYVWMVGRYWAARRRFHAGMASADAD